MNLPNESLVAFKPWFDQDSIGSLGSLGEPIKTWISIFSKAFNFESRNQNISHYVDVSPKIYQG